MMLIAAAITLMMVFPIFSSSEEDTEVEENEVNLPEDIEDEVQVENGAFPLFDEDDHDDALIDDRLPPRFEDGDDLNNSNGDFEPVGETVITTDRELTEADSESILHNNSYANRFYLSGGEAIVGSNSNEAFFFRGNVSEGGSNFATGGGGEDAFVLEFGDTIDPPGSMNYVEDFDDEIDQIGATFHDSVEYDQEQDKIYEVSHNVDNIQGYRTDEGFRIDVSVKQIRTVELDSGEEQISEAILIKSMVLRGVEDYDLSRLSVSNNWRIFVH